MVASGKNWGNENCIKIIFEKYVTRTPQGRPTNKLWVVSAESNARTD